VAGSADGRGWAPRPRARYSAFGGRRLAVQAFRTRFQPAARVADVDPREALQRYWGYDSFRPLQREAVDAALAGRDCLLVLPTGGGKSICYQLPAACDCGLTLVISPLISLMDDQVAAARQAGLNAAALHSNLVDDERRAVRRRALAGELQLLYISPERFAGGDLVTQL